VNIRDAFLSWHIRNPDKALSPLDDDGVIGEYVAFLNTLTADCMYSYECLAQWMPDFTTPGPDAFRMEPVLAVFDNSEIFEVIAPADDEVRAPAFPDLSGLSAQDIAGCQREEVSAPLEFDILPGFRKVTDSGFSIKHEVGAQILSNAWTVAETALVVGSIASADIDGDCDMDVLIGLGVNAGIKVYLNVEGEFIEAENNFGLNTAGDIAAFSLTDINGDSWPDLFVGHLYEADSKLWLNRGGAEFIRVADFGHETIRSTHSASFADIDGDGDLDLFSTNWDFLPTSEEIHMWANDGRGGFAPVLDDVLYGAFGSRDYTFTANFADMNNDFTPDLLVAADFLTSQVFQGDGNGDFHNATDSSVIRDRNAMGSALGDYDNDGDLDWFVTNVDYPFGSYSSYVNRLYRNDSIAGENIQFADVSYAANVIDGLWAWGACMKDFDNDGWLDIYQVNGFGYDNNTFDHPLFEILNWIGISGIYDLNDSSSQLILEALYGFFGGFEEINQALSWLYQSEDGFFSDLEALIQASKILYVNHGPGSIMLDNFYGTPSRLYMNNQDGTFTESALLRGIADTGEGRGIVCNDFDRDGDIDIVIMNHNGKPSYYENHFRHAAASGRNFLNVRLHGLQGNVYAYGAKVYATSESLNQYREMRFENNYMSNNAPELHFGLSADDVVSELRVEWPDGQVSVLENVAANQFLVVEHPSRIN
ncbi:MAG: CRTAC1 family protein, partial [Thalassolituus sp.]